MSDTEATSRQQRKQLSPVWSILLGLVAGITLGVILRAFVGSAIDDIVAVADLIGSLWINALRMTIIPLVFGLVVAGVASTAANASARGTPGRAVILFLLLYGGCVLVTLLLAPALLALWPVQPETAQALRLGAAAESTQIPAVPGLTEWLRSLIPPNPFAAAAEGALLPLIVFALFLGFALGKGESVTRERFIAFFGGLADTMLILVRWVLWVAPLGVFALGLVLSGRAGIDAVSGLAQFAIIVSVVVLVVGALAYPLAVIGGRTAPIAFARAAIPAQAVAISTQSSLASLPAMIEGVRTRLGKSETAAGVVLPLAVSLLRTTGPAAMLTAAYFTAKVYGIAPPPGALVAAGLVGIAVSFGSVGLPGQAAFFAKYVPVFTVLGLPLEFLPMLLAVEIISDMFQTVANVTHDMAAATVLDRTQTLRVS